MAINFIKAFDAKKPPNLINGRLEQKDFNREKEFLSILAEESIDFRIFHSLIANLWTRPVFGWLN